MSTVDHKLAPAHTLSRRGEGPNPIDVHVGARLRQCRTLMGLSQEKLGEAVGITFQQLQKYERGANRISASRLFNLSQVLGVSVSFFFDEIPPKVLGEERSQMAAEDPEETDGDEELSSLTRRETLELVRAYYRIGAPPVRRRAFELIKALGGEVGVLESA